jgi:23S rRNA pseudouridine1911/1915/1917 synthase
MSGLQTQPMRKLPRKGSHGSRNRSPRPPRFPRQIEILYEDDAVIAVNKPAGLLAVPVKGFDTPSALSVLSEEFKSIKKRVFVVHRIDRYTSGILLFAKTERDREALVRQFLAHTPVRKYLAVIRGHLGSKEGKLIHYFRREGMFQKLSNERDRGAAQAELRYSVQRTLPGASLVEVTLMTGLQNQIRVQFLAIGHPVIGDRKYCPQEASERRIHRVALHASHLDFVHPRSSEIVSIDCEVPADFRSLLEQKPKNPS